MPTSEQAFLKLIDRHFPATGDTVALGRGDDCAIIRCGERICLSTDLMVDTVHFRRTYFSPEDLGHKALAVNLSDVAAMGGKPLGFTLDLMVPDDLPAGFWDPFFSSMAELAEKYSVTLAGGDLSRSPHLGVGVTIWGEPGDTGRFLTRGNAQPGDVLFVAGPIGMARVGLLALEEDPDEAWKRYPESCLAHLRPVPRVAEGLALANIIGTTGGVRGCMDLSDGLARDLPRFLDASPAPGADLTLTPKPLHGEILAWTRTTDRKPVEFALLGGEDYALLAAVHPADLPEVQAVVPGLVEIGRASDEPGIRLGGVPYETPGFDHFGG